MSDRAQVFASVLGLVLLAALAAPALGAEQCDPVPAQRLSDVEWPQRPSWVSRNPVRAPSDRRGERGPVSTQVLADGDGDTIDDSVDNCLALPNTDQADTDEDGVGNVCDNCPATPNPRPTMGSEDFEGETADWSHAPLTGADTWHLDYFSCFGDPLGTRAYTSNGNAGPACAPDSSREHSRLLGPPVTLPVTTGSIVLSFDAVSFDEFGSCLASGDFDAKEVGITTDGGGTWTTLNDCYPLTTVEGEVVHHVLDIAAFAGQTVQVIFLYDTQDTIGLDTFAVDNVVISSNGVAQTDSDDDGAGDECDPCPLDPEDDMDEDEVCGDVDNCPVHFNPAPPRWDENFTSGGVGWTHESFGAGADTWHPASTTCFGAALGSPMVVSNGNYGPACTEASSTEKSRLLSPPFVMPTWAADLEFEAVSFDEQGSCLTSGEFDAKDVGITTDGGQTYTRLNHCYGLTEMAGDVVDHLFVVPGFPGYTFQVIFVYDTRDNDVGHTFAIDDVIISPHQDDADSDGMGNACDPCPDDPLNDGDEDGWCAPVDNCPIDANPLQENQDGDAAGDACDCARGDGSAFAVPGDVADLHLTDSVSLVWDSLTGSSGTGTTYDVVRGALDELPVGSGPSETCLGPAVALPTIQDLAEPSSGHGFYYLVRGANNCGSGPYGFDSSAGERLTTVCP